MEPTGSAVHLPADELWQRLSAFDFFKHFAEEDRDSFLKAYEREAAMRVRRFAREDLVCRRGDYELDLCFILRGAVDLYGEAGEKRRTKLTTIGAGGFYGELGALGGLPRTTDVVASEGVTEIFYLPRHCLKFVEINSEARALLAANYHDRALRAVVAQIELFRDAPPDFVNQLIARCKIHRYDLRGIMILKQGQPGDALYIVRDGFVQVVREREDGSHRVLAYLRSGEYFGEMALLGGAVHNASVLTAGKCELIEVRPEDFLELCKERPEIETGVRRTIERRHEEERRITPEISELLEKSGQLGFVQADALLVMDLDLCIKCDQCVKACESLHGESRLIRTGMQIGKYLVPAACRHCDDPKCMNSCPTGAIKRRPEGEIYFQYDMCIGCGNCAIACPYDNIAMIETPKFDQAQAKKAKIMGDPKFFRPYPVASHSAQSLWSRIFAAHEKGARERLAPSLWQRIRGRNAELEAAEPTTEESAGTDPHIPIAYPIKCDLCDGLPFMGCVHSCPTGSAMRIDPAALFAETGAVSAGTRVSSARGGKD